MALLSLINLHHFVWKFQNKGKEKQTDGMSLHKFNDLNYAFKLNQAYCQQQKLLLRINIRDLHNCDIEIDGHTNENLKNRNVAT